MDKLKVDGLTYWGVLVDGMLKVKVPKLRLSEGWKNVVRVNSLRSHEIHDMNI